MGRTHEALERAEKQYLEIAKTTPGPIARPYKAPTPTAVSDQNGREYYHSLKANLVTLYNDQTIRTILFCGTAHGDGATTTAFNFAATLAGDRQSMVLVIDANLRTPRLHDVCQIDHTPGLSDHFKNTREPVFPVVWKELPNLYVMPCGSNHSSPLSLFNGDRFAEFLKAMREKFDWVILDGPPLPRFSESRVVCAKVDGVVLVAKSGHTRREVALRAKKEIEDAGGRILGVVLNKRKFYIPDWIYRRL